MDVGTVTRRRPTVLICDLVESSRITERLDSEAFWNVLVAFQDVCNQVVSRFDGYINKSLGDGLMVLFGIPRAHEDDALRAVYTGLGIVESVRKLAPSILEKHGVELSVRVGIHTGDVVAGEVFGMTDVAGTIPHQAARIQTEAAPDSVVISRQTAHLVSGYFDLREKGLVPLRGFSHPIELFEVLRPLEVEGRLEAQGGVLTPMVGRQVEQAQLFELWEATKNGGANAVLLRGEAGIGKSRLARFIRDLSARTGGGFLQGACSPYYTSTAFYPLARMLSRRCGLSAELANAEKLALLEQEVKEAQLDPANVIPYLAPILSIELDDGGPYPPPRQDASKLRQATIESFKQWWAGLAAAEPRVVLIEDLHWAEPSSLEMIEHALADLPLGLLLVMTARPEFQPDGWASRSTVVDLKPLPLADRHRMIQSMRVGDLPESLADEIAERSDGVPLFVEELLWSVFDHASAGEGSKRVPATIRDLLVARLEAAAPNPRFAQAAAVIGSRFEVDLLSDVTKIPPQQLRLELDSLASNGILETQGLGNERRFAFRHSLIRDAAYESLLPESLRTLHADVAQALMNRLRSTSPPDRGVIAFHLDQAGRSEDAVAFYVEAAQAAQSTGAYAEALSKLDRALQLILVWPAGEPRALSELTVRVLKAASLVATSGYGSEAARQEFETALVLAESLGPRLESVGVRLAIMAYATVRGLRAKAGEIIEGLKERLSQASADEALLYGAEVVVTDALHQYGLGHYQIARDQFEHAIELFRARPEGFDTSPLWTLPNSPEVAAHAQLVPVLWVQGEREAAVQAAAEALELSSKLGFPAGPFSEAYSRAYLGYMYQLEGDFGRAVDEFRMVTNLGTRHGFAMWESLGSIHALIAAAHLELTPETVGAIGHTRLLLHQLGVSSFQPYFLTAQAELTAGLGDLPTALHLFDEAVKVSNDLEERHYLAETFRKRAVARAQRGGDPRAVAADLVKAFEIARDQNAFLFQVRAAIEMHQLLDSGSRPPLASEALASSRSVLELSAYPEAEQAEALLAANK
jgi:class 3 adenylate cyclase/tetratricopeptide (TPR) repeat protein